MTHSSIATGARAGCTCFALAALMAVPLGAQDPAPKTTICLAPTAAQMASGSTTDGATAVRETLGSYLTGPTLAVAPLTARLSSQVREEAKLASCKHIVFTSMKLESRTMSMPSGSAGGLRHDSPVRDPTDRRGRPAPRSGTP